MDDARDWTWSFRTARPAVELFMIATVLLAIANLLPGLVIAGALTENRDEAPSATAASPELLAGEDRFAAMIGGFGAALALAIAIGGYLVVRRWGRGSPDVDSPRTVATAATTSSAAIVAAFFAGASDTSLAEACAVGAVLLVIASLAAVGASQLHAALRTTPR
jgi:hypothetical protein